MGANLSGAEGGGGRGQYPVVDCSIFVDLAVDDHRQGNRTIGPARYPSCDPEQGPWWRERLRGRESFLFRQSLLPLQFPLEEGRGLGPIGPIAPRGIGWLIRLPREVLHPSQP